MTDKETIEAYKRLSGKLIDALTFYGDIDSYFAIQFFCDPPCGGFYDDGEEIDGRWRPGKRARDTLEEVSKEFGDLTVWSEEVDV